jgi:hypothetical protein
VVLGSIYGMHNVGVLANPLVRHEQDGVRECEIACEDASLMRYVIDRRLVLTTAALGILTSKHTIRALKP